MKRLYIFIFLVGLLGNNIMYAQIPASSQSLPSPNVAVAQDFMVRFRFQNLQVCRIYPFLYMKFLSEILNCRFLSIIMPPGYVRPTSGMGRNGVEFKYRRSCIQNGEGQAR